MDMTSTRLLIACLFMLYGGVLAMACSTSDQNRNGVASLSEGDQAGSKTNSESFNK